MTDVQQLLDLAQPENRTPWLNAVAMEVPTEVSLVNDNIEHKTKKWRHVALPVDLLKAFLALENAQPPAILRFAERYGVLELCRHQKPVSHDPRCDAALFLRNSTPVVAYQQWACRYRLVIEAIAALRQGSPSPWLDYDFLQARRTSARSHLVRREIRQNPDKESADWTAIDRPTGRRKESAPANWVDVARNINVWVQWANLGPQVAVGSDDPVIVLASPDPRGTSQRPSMSLFGALTFQALSIISESRPEYRCSGCEKKLNLAERARRPSPSRRMYCVRCRREGHSKRDARKAYREREKLKQARGHD